MQNHYAIKHPRGSSPLPKQDEQELHDQKNGFTFSEQNPDNSYKTRTNRESTPVQSLTADTDNTGHWQDDGGEGG